MNWISDKGSDSYGDISQKVGLFDLIAFSTLLVFPFSPIALKLVITGCWSALSLVRPAYYLLSFFVLLFMDSMVVVPIIERSITFVIAPIGVLGALLQFMISRDRVRLPGMKIEKSLIIGATLFFISVLMSTAVSYSSGTINLLRYESGFIDQSRGIVILMILSSGAIVIAMVNRAVVFIYRRLWIIVVAALFTFILSIMKEQYGLQRFEGTLGDPNYASRAYLVALIISVYLVKTNTLRIALTITFIFAILETSSRAGFIATFIALVVWAIQLAKSRKVATKNRKTLVAATATIACIIFVIIVFPGISELSVFKRMSEAESFHKGATRIEGDLDRMTGGRTFLWRTSIDEWADKGPLEILMGVGVGRSPLLMASKLGKVTVVHNQFLELVLEAGIFGGVAFLWLVYGIAVTARYAMRGHRVSTQIAVAWTFMSLTLSGIWTKHTFTIILLFFVVSLMEGERKKGVSNSLP